MNINRENNPVPEPTKRQRPRVCPKRPEQKSKKATDLEIEHRIHVAMNAAADNMCPNRALMEIGVMNERTRSTIIAAAKKRYQSVASGSLEEKKKSLIVRVQQDARLAKPGSRAALRRLEADLEGLIVVKTAHYEDKSIFDLLGVNHEPESTKTTTEPVRETDPQ